MTVQTLGDVLAHLIDRKHSCANVPVAGLALDSRLVQPGFVFFAVAGADHDGHDYIEEAIDRGASAIVCERKLANNCSKPIPMISTKNIRWVTGLAAHHFYGKPSERLSVVGITGTNGKTTTAFAIESLLLSAGLKPMLMGSIVQRRPGGREHSSAHTTPDAITLQRELADAVSEGCTHAVLEVSSHALSQQRLAGCQVNVAAFSNISRDHLDYHGTFENYLAAKRTLFSKVLVGGGTAIVNTDADHSAEFIKAIHERGDVTLLRCGRSRHADIRAKNICSETQGTSFDIHHANGQFTVVSPLIGTHNADNLLLAASCGLALGLDEATIAAGAKNLSCVPGRLQHLSPKLPFSLFVDYAHTPDALSRVLKELRPITEGRLIVLFGCGGQRDRPKRPIMGHTVGQLADIVCVTSDNPRNEQPEIIIEQILDGLRQTQMTRVSQIDKATPAGCFWVDPDRKNAICSAVCALTANDTLLIAGKGHETVQMIGSNALPFDDRQVARQCLEQKLDPTHHE